MKIFTSNQIRQLDVLTVEKKRMSSLDLMESAACAMFQYLRNVISVKRDVYVFAGSGNNGGDAFALARLLLEGGFKVHVFFVWTRQMSPDCLANYLRLSREFYLNVKVLSDVSGMPSLDDSCIVIDGLLGTGLNRPLTGIFKDVVDCLNRMETTVYAIDIPSGLMADGITLDISVVRATETLTFQMPKLSFMFPENTSYVGRFTCLDIGLDDVCVSKTETPYSFLERVEIKSLLRSRSVSAHKGVFGHALFVGGSRGKSGAAILASHACLRTGVGLLTSYVPACVAQILAISLPEAMTESAGNGAWIMKFPQNLAGYSAVGVGCGLGIALETKSALAAWLPNVNMPVVADADALNLLAGTEDGLSLLPVGSIITPHLKEFDRLAGHSDNHEERLRKAVFIAKKNTIFVVLKGHHTVIACPDGHVFFNSTGNAGMATAGSGDVLTGVILSLLAQGYDSQSAACLGVFLHGFAGDLAAAECSQQAMLASDIVLKIGAAYLNIQE